MSRTSLAFIYFGVCALIVLFIVFLSQDTPARYLAPFLGSVLITIGWIVASENTIKNAQRQQSVSIVLYYNGDKVGQKHRATIVEFLPDPKTILQPGGELPSFGDEGHPLLRAIDYELNFFEFVAVGVRREVLHEGLIKDSFYTNFLQMRDSCRQYIAYVQGRYGPTVWVHYSWICDKWGKEGASELSEWTDRL